MRPAIHGTKNDGALVPGNPPICLVVVPTAGVSRKNPWVPDRAGLLRLEAAKEALEQYPEAKLVITGGYANRHRISLALLYALHLVYQDGLIGWHTTAWKRLVCVEGRTDNTFDDLPLALKDVAVDHGDGVLICTKRRHFRRIKWVVRHVRYVPKLKLSRERDRWSLVEWVLGILARRDPGLQGRWIKVVRFVATYYSARRHMIRFWFWRHFHRDQYAALLGAAALLQREMEHDGKCLFPKV